MTGTVLEYQAPHDRPRASRRPLFALLFSLVGPAVGVALLIAVGDRLNDWFDAERPVLIWIFAAFLTATPLLAMTLGGMALGAAHAVGGRRRDHLYAAGAIVLGWLQAVVLAVILAGAWRA